MSIGGGHGVGSTLTPVDEALDQLANDFDHLVKLVEDGGLDHYDDTGLVGFLHGFEQLRNRLSLVDHVTVAEGRESVKVTGCARFPVSRYRARA